MNYINEYLDMIESEPFAMCKEQKLLGKFIRNILEKEKDNLFLDEKKLDKYLSYEKYFPFKLFPWEKFLAAIILTLYEKDTNSLRFDTYFILVGRG